MPSWAILDISVPWYLKLVPPVFPDAKPQPRTFYSLTQRAALSVLVPVPAPLCLLGGAIGHSWAMHAYRLVPLLNALLSFAGREGHAC